MTEEEIIKEIIKRCANYVCTHDLTRSECLLIDDFVKWLNSWSWE